MSAIRNILNERGFTEAAKHAHVFNLAPPQLDRDFKRAEKGVFRMKSGLYFKLPLKLTPRRMP